MKTKVSFENEDILKNCEGSEESIIHKTVGNE